MDFKNGWVELYWKSPISSLWIRFSKIFLNHIFFAENWCNLDMGFHFNSQCQIGVRSIIKNLFWLIHTYHDYSKSMANKVQLEICLYISRIRWKCGNLEISLRLIWEPTSPYMSKRLTFTPETTIWLIVNWTWKTQQRNIIHICI